MKRDRLLETMIRQGDLVSFKAALDLAKERGDAEREKFLSERISLMEWIRKVMGEGPKGEPTFLMGLCTVQYVSSRARNSRAKTPRMVVLLHGGFSPFNLYLTWPGIRRSQTDDKYLLRTAKRIEETVSRFHEFYVEGRIRDGLPRLHGWEGP